MIDYRYPHTGRLAERAWELRHTLTFYDGLYVALAAVLDVPLLTGDVKLSKAPGLSCQLMLINCPSQRAGGLTRTHAAPSTPASTGARCWCCADDSSQPTTTGSVQRPALFFGRRVTL